MWGETGKQKAGKGEFLEHNPLVGMKLNQQNLCTFEV